MGTTGKSVGYHSCRIKRYNCGVMEVMAASRDIFKEPDADSRPNPVCTKIGTQKKNTESAEDRSRRRARAKLKEYALANEWDWFVTLTLDEKVIERYDLTVIMQGLKDWLSNQVRRHGLRYILVPERHKKGGIHFHGFFYGGSLNPVDSGHVDKRGHCIFNLERWTFGFTTAIRLYGSFESAVGYVCKYISKEKLAHPIGGRWYYHGGKFEKPVVEYADISPDELQQAQPNGYAFEVKETGTEFYMVSLESHNNEIMPVNNFNIVKSAGKTAESSADGAPSGGTICTEKSEGET